MIMGSAAVHPPRRLEGTWEEIAARADELRGKRVVVTVLDEEKEMTSQEIAERAAARKRIFEEIDELMKNAPSSPPPRTKPDPFGDALLEEYLEQTKRFRK